MLANKGRGEETCTLDLQSLTSVNAVGYWKTEPIEEPLRGFTKKVGNAKQSAKWRLLNRNADTISEYKSNQINWDITWSTTTISYIGRSITDDKEN